MVSTKSKIKPRPNNMALVKRISVGITYPTATDPNIKLKLVGTMPNQIFRRFCYKLL